MIVRPVHYDLAVPIPDWGPDGLRSLAAFVAEICVSNDVALMRPGNGVPENVIVDPPEHRAGYSIYPVVWYLWFSGPNPDFFADIDLAKIKRVAPILAQKIAQRYYPTGIQVAVVLERAQEAKFATAA